ncbi:MAG: competence/damage-inducible protein A [Methylophilaceae bacterium]|nr:competence/damage-inducible protein A [Methylophilaceae bacterium]
MITPTPAFGAIIIGDEILSGKRQDGHFRQIINALNTRGLALAWCEMLGDDPARITACLQRSMASGDIVFSFGGIGATPDDFTRQCAATAASVELARHAGAVAEIEAQFGEGAYPKRVLMADFPLGAELIPNPINRVAGFSLHHHHFLPGFPEMAWPMLAWVLDHHYAHLFHQQPTIEAAIMVLDAGESQLLDLMNTIVKRYPTLKLFSLPRLDKRRSIELGVKGEPAAVSLAMDEIKAGVTAAGFEWNTI